MSPYTAKLLRVRALRESGYPWEANDLEPEEWMDLVRLDGAISQQRLKE